MKKIILVFLAIFSISLAQAQKLKIGLKAGPSLASLRDHRFSNDLTYRLKFHGGVMGNVQLFDIIHFQPEILYSQKGFEFKDGRNTYVGKFDYIDVPLMLQAHIDKFFVEFGPQASFLATAKLGIDDGEVDYNKLVKSTVVGVNAGLGYLSNNFLLGLRYSTDANDSFVRLFNEKTKAKNSVIQISVGYFLPY